MGLDQLTTESNLEHLDPIAGTRQGLELVSDKWTVLVIFALKQEKRRLSDLQRQIEGITQKVLIQTLRKLECYGLVKRTVYPVIPPKVEYSLTPLGETLLEPLYAICRWTDEHWQQMQAAAQHFHAKQANRGLPLR
ncbi:HxlR family transcriptional regulator [Thermosporothrix hazakensis]|jgi:DNA-binding HxlR family transcriptional regulator|uniref:HxlR family transcriptional regulator n=2 Tax=Thermosporothrix TaxID=768650 RepID=A0A326UA68_THEHA|nr:helix-turn-helix domain-containing protein [Thermosporothrix hazakensis]PZW32692.1 HxlR family transcriptional regulator [Thermosporothrix hazakensis]BBH87612.1 transcriptional regulator [Thermosporothrix sp. COM3]GCE50047.1 transcriptional regulator [Thermosporothrix hazakensis]